MPLRSTAPGSRVASAVLLALALALVLHGGVGALGQTAGESGVTVHGHVRTDGCLTYPAPLGPHGLPVADTVVGTAYRARLALVAGAAPSRAGERLEGPPAARLRDVARRRMRGVVRRVMAQGLDWLRGLEITGRVGLMGERAVWGGRVRVPSRIPVVGGMAEGLTVEARQCPVAYRVPGTYGPVTCDGLRVMLEIGPLDGSFRGFIRAEVRDYCFGEGAAADEVVVRPYEIRGRVRSIPFIPQGVFEHDLTMQHDHIQSWLSSGLEAEAGVYEARVPPVATPAPAPAEPAPLAASPVPAACVAPIARASARYYELLRRIATSLAPWNAEIDAALWSVWHRGPPARAAVVPPPASTRRPIPQPSPHAWLADALADITRGLNAPSPCARDLALGLRDDARPRCGSLLDVEYYAARPEHAGIGPREPLVVRVCRQFRVADDPDASWHTGLPSDRDAALPPSYSCSLLHPGIPARISHEARVFDPIDPTQPALGGAVIERTDAGGTTREQFVTRVLAAVGATSCAEFVRPLVWPDAPPRRAP